MFGKKKEQPAKKPLDYASWEADFGFLTLVMSRKKNITKEYLINMTAIQRKENDLLDDADIDPIVESCVRETIEGIGEEYKTFLINKYFGSERNLISFIAEDVYYDLTTDTINRNRLKIKQSLNSKISASIVNLNKETPKISKEKKST